jgi:hypothetical protein
MSNKGKHRILLRNLDVNRWYLNVSRGSRVTADVYLRRLGSFCEKFDLSPADLVLMGEDQIYNILLDLVSSMESKYAGSYIQSVVKAVKSWLSHNGIVVKRKIKIRRVQDTPSLRDERVPTQVELKRIFLSGDKKTRVSCVLVAHSGLRIKTIGNYEGNDGLTIKDFPEITIKYGTIQFMKIPTLLIVRSELSKAGHRYFTFLSEEGCEYLKDYLEERIREGEKLDFKSSIVTPKNRSKPFITATNVGDSIRGSIRRSGLKWRPYVLRSYFDTQLMLAESKGLVLRDYRQFWMGHKGDIENRYTTNKQNLPQSVIEDMREAYRRSQEFIQTTTSSKTSEERIKESFKKQLLLVAGFKDKEIKEIDLSNITDEEFQSIVRRRLVGVMEKNGNKQKVIQLNKVERYIGEGWEYVASLPNDRAIIKTPF